MTVVLALRGPPMSHRPAKPSKVARCRLAPLALLLWLTQSSAWGDDLGARWTAEDFEFFESRVRPVLVERCYACHSDLEQLESDLSLTSRDALLRGGASGPAAEQRNVEGSLLVQAVRYRGALQMPPDGKLPDDQIAALEEWVARGLPWPPDAGARDAEQENTSTAGPAGAGSLEHGFQISDDQRRFWSFQPLARPSAAPVRNEGWCINPVDRFLLAKLEEAGLAPAAPADRRSLIRRATFDLTGLPPTPAEIDAFLSDPAPDAFAQVVDRLLASPQYGERWGRHWLDLVRYTDSFDARTADGSNVMDCHAAWRYRDWVVGAFNVDMPYDQFIMNQVAGDLLPASDGAERNLPGIIATGVLAIGNWGGGDADKEKLLTDIADDQIDLVGRAFMGLTLACARCHDHKFDPISTADYYALAGIFMSTHILEDPGPKTNGPPMLRVSLETTEQAAQRAAYDARMAALKAELESLTAAEASEPERAAKQAQIDELAKAAPGPASYAHACLEG
ncbi:MAG: DUF1549 domain-containing protein, partial [Pirellulales bacterium]|nr:DUF1549 domain-containing protein [Pirellulales bacterium]